MQYTPADWMKMGKDDRKKWFDRVHRTTRAYQDDLAVMEADWKDLRRTRPDLQEDVQRIREKIEFHLGGVNMHLNTLAHVMI